VLFYNKDNISDADKKAQLPEIIIREPIVPEHQKGSFKQKVDRDEYSELRK